MGAGEDDALRGELIGQLAAALDGLVRQVERERATRTEADAEWFDLLLAELRPMAEQARDLEASRTIRDIVVRHGSGPWPTEDLAAIAGEDLARVRRILDALTESGVAWPDSGETGR
ncbi:hypothetical protein [Nocardia sp. SC052]|uniref:hypothetical protein n=1 Tax=Nocardia sichangensis TaxID=3385975 RepID=UPI0039A20528